MKLLLQKIRGIKITKQFWIGLVLGIPFTIGGLFLIVLVEDKITALKNKKVNLESQKTLASIHNETPSPSPLPYILIPSEINWLDKPEKVPSLNVFKSQKEIDDLFKDSFGGSPNISKYYFLKIADVNDGSALIKAYLNESDYFSYIHQTIFIVNKNDITALANKTYGSDKETLSDLLLPSIQIKEGIIQDLEVPDTIVSEKGFIYTDPSAQVNFDSLSDVIKIDDSKYGELYASYVKNEIVSGYSSRSIYLKLKDNSGINYNSSIIVSRYDEKVQKITWNDESVNDLAYSIGRAWRGCGADHGIEVLKGRALNLDDNNSNIIGKTFDNQPVYQVKDPNIFNLKGFYDIYKSSVYNPDKLVSYNEFISNKNYFIWKDQLGDFQLYLNPDYVQMAECGKPVIYLYPEKEQQVNVQVGAKISESEPVYPTNGWTVLAKPNGELNYLDKTYPYLFWEGLGNGIYPEVKNRGFVVSKNYVESTLREHLSKLGLSQKESNDFLEFWLTKMPETPYTRLTWLMTNEMNQLAPLTVNPKPDTEIRIFLDFEGLNKKVSLIPQKLFAPKRNGFTLVEWGGLLIK